MDYLGLVLDLNKPSPFTGRIYPVEVVKEALDEYNFRGDARLGELCPAEHIRRVDEGQTSINIANISHRILNTYVNENNCWVAEIKVLDTPGGNFVKTMLDSRFSLTLIPRSTGHVDDNNVVEEFRIIALDIAANTTDKTEMKELPTNLFTKEELKKALLEGVMEVSFTKVDGSVRIMECTLSDEYIPAPTNKKQEKRKKKPNDAVLSVWDVNKDGWRSFRVENVFEVKKV